MLRKRTAVTLVTVLTLAGVTPALAAKALTKHAFDVRANAICLRANTAGHAVRKPTDAAGYSHAAKAIESIANTELAALKPLRPPTAALTTLWHKFLATIRNETNLSIGAINAASTGDSAMSRDLLRQVTALQSTQTARAATLGTQVCAQ